MGDVRLPTIDFSGIEVPPAPPGEFLLMDEPQHGRYRKPLVGKFTVRRMRQLTERVEQITAEHRPRDRLRHAHSRHHDL